MSEVAFLCVDTRTGRCTRYVPTRLVGKRLREAGTIEIQNWNAYRALPQETREALEQYRASGVLR